MSWDHEYSVFPGVYSRDCLISLFIFIFQDYVLSIFMRQRWHDSRLAFLHLSNETMVTLDARLSDSIWLPDLFFTNEKRAYFHEVTIPNRYMRLFQNGTIYYSARWVDYHYITEAQSIQFFFWGGGDFFFFYIFYLVCHFFHFCYLFSKGKIIIVPVLWASVLHYVKDMSGFPILFSHSVNLRHVHVSFLIKLLEKGGPFQNLFILKGRFYKHVFCFKKNAVTQKL